MSSKNKYFDEVDPKIDFPKMERELLDRWNKYGIVDKYLNKNKNSKKYFSFQDGPITANNPMGVHHAWGRTYKDLWPRFKSMQGYRQRHQNGFDCQGLWVEVEVEKEQGFKNKKDIEKFGVEKFVNLCKERVKKYSAIQTEQSKRLGYFADWDNSYYTLSDDNNYMIWHFLKVVHENGWLYKGNDSVPWCPRCETAISQHEMLTEDYKEAVHDSIYMKFPIKDSDENLLVWTTTPWTIPANIAVAVDKKLDYVLVEIDGIKLWLADEAKTRVLKDLDYKEIKKCKGSDLVGLKYSGAFDDLPAVSDVSKSSDKFHTVVATDNLIMPITTTEGTGMVHTAVSAGTEDFKLGKKLGLPMIPVINDDASYMEGFNELSGQNAKKHPELILEIMKSRGFAFKVERYFHRYPACWRCKTELVWKVTDEWYISMDAPSKTQNLKNSKTLRERMKKVTKEINWIPKFGLKRELDWLDNMHDWLISKKNRYWGLALPIWECSSCGNFEVIGGKVELKEKAIYGWKEFEGKSPHKPQIDEIKIKCSKCGEITSRIEPVGNPWLDAGIVQFSTISENNKASNFDVTDTKPLYLTNKKEWKKWFPVDFITESFPGQFKNWFYSMIAMSTVLENKNPFKTVLGFATQLGEDGRPMHKSWGNAIEFNEAADKIGSDVMRWMFVRQDPSQNLLFGYKVADETRRQFHLKLWNIYNFFITYANMDGFHPSKDSRNQKLQKSNHVLDQWILIRLNQTISEVTDALEKYDAYNASSSIDKFVDDLSVWYLRRSRDRRNSDFYSTMYYVLCTVSKLLAPFTPFLAETIYTNLTKEQSVHLTSWPTSKILSDKDKEILSEMQRVREIAEIGHALRKEANIPVRQPLSTLFTVHRSLSTELTQLILDELNIKSIKYGQKENKFDLIITPELQEEADTRDLIRKIQEARKQMRINISDKIVLTTDWMPNEEKLKDLILKKTLVKSVKMGEFGVSLANEV